MSSKPLKVLIVSYDWADSASKNPQGIIQKLKRDHLYSEQREFLLVSWSRRSEIIWANNKVKVIHLRGRFSKIRPLYDVLMAFRIPFILRKHLFTPDLTITYDFPLIFSLIYPKIFWGSKTVMLLTNLPKELAKTKKYQLLAGMYYSVTQRIGGIFLDHIRVINSATRKYALNIGIGEDRIFPFSPNTIEQDVEHIKKVKKGLIRRQFGIKDEEHLILSVGRLEPEKNFDLLIHSFAKSNIKNTKLIIVGEGALRQSLERLVDKCGLSQRIIFSGHVSRKDIWNYYQDADVFVLLSQSEALGLVFWEAMYMRVPVIGSRASGIVETIGSNGERGFFWEESDGIDKLKKDITLCLNRSGVKDMLESAKQYVETKINASFVE